MNVVCSIHFSVLVIQLVNVEQFLNAMFLPILSACLSAVPIPTPSITTISASL